MFRRKNLAMGTSVRAGFTLIEMMVGLAVASIVIMAAVAFAHDEIKALGRGNQNLDMLQTGRASLDLLMRDLTNAGAGLGYGTNNDFPGIQPSGTFNVGPLSSGSSPPFSANNAGFVDAMWGYATVNDDVLIRASEVTTNTIVETPQLKGQWVVCSPTRLQNGSMAVLRDAVGTMTSVRPVSGLTVGTPCGECVGTGLCDTFTLGTAASLGAMGWDNSGTEPVGAFSQGSIATGYHTTIWFMTYGADNFPQLRRAVDTDCARGPTCGDLVSDNIDTLQVRYFRWDETAIPQNWVLHAGPINTRERFRMDVELVVRSRTMEDQQFHPAVRLGVEGAGGGTFPPTAPVLTAVQRNSLRFQRIILRNTIQLRNTGV